MRPNPSSAARPARGYVGLRVGLAVLAGTTLFFLLVLARYNWNPLVFVEIGPLFSEGLPGADNGYDGQFAYYIATEGAGAVSKLDLPPAFRYQRILYPALSAVLALGQRALVPWTMLLINILAHAAAAGLLARLLATRTRASPWWALVPALWVGTLTSIRLDLNEPLAIAFSLLALVLHLEGRWLLAGAVFGLAGLAKELGLVLIGGVILCELWQRRWSRASILAVLAGGPYAAWGVFLRLWLGPSPDQAGPPRLPLLLPFANLTYAQNALELVLIIVWAIIPALLIGIAALRRLRRRVDQPETWLAVIAALYISYIPPATTAELISTLRVIQPLLVAGILFLAAFDRRRLPWLGALWAPTVLLAALIAFF